MQKIMNEKILMAFIGLIATMVNTFADDLFSDGQIYAFAAIVVGFILKPRETPEVDLNEAVDMAIRKIEEKKNSINRRS